MDGEWIAEARVLAAAEAPGAVAALLEEERPNHFERNRRSCGGPWWHTFRGARRRAHTSAFLGVYLGADADRLLS